MTNDDIVWYIGSQQRSPDGTKVSGISAHERVSDEEKNSIETALQFINELTKGSPYKRLYDKYEDFNEYASGVLERSKIKSPRPQDLEEIFEKLDDFLSALRAFDDITKRKLSDRYGKQSREFITFVGALSFEFDNVFAYRLCYQMRNYSQHAGSPITGIHSDARLEDEKPVAHLRIVMDSNTLLKKYSKWQARVKEELKKVNGEIELQPILHSLMASCSRAYSKYLISQEKEIQKSIQKIKDSVKSVPKDEPPILMGIQKNVKTSEDLKELKIQVIDMNLIKLLEHALQQAHSIVRLF